MKKNMGTADVIIRWILGIILLLLLFLDHSGIRWIGLLGIVFIVTALFRYCPLYSLFKINTNK
jgi:hypothetical protein